MAAPTESSELRNTVVNLRLQASARDLIDRAAEALGKSRTDFMVEAARREAEAVLLDRCFFSLDSKSFRKIADALDKPPAKNLRLRKLLKSAAPWDK